MLRVGAPLGWVVLSFTAALFVVNLTWSKAATTGEAVGLDAVRASGVIRFGADFAGAPGAFFDDNHVMQGSDYELCNAAAARLGLKATWTNLSFGGLIPALIAERFDAICSAMYVTPERSKVLVFVPYRRSGYGGAVVKGNPNNVHDVSDMCGLNAVTVLGTVHEKQIRAQNQTCIAEGKKEIDLKTFSNAADAASQLVDARADIWLEGDPVLGFYIHKQSNAIQQAFMGKDPRFIGVGIMPDNAALGQAISSAFATMKADGTYRKILGKYGLDAGAISTFDVHPVVGTSM